LYDYIQLLLELLLPLNYSLLQCFLSAVLRSRRMTKVYWDHDRCCCY